MCQAFDNHIKKERKLGREEGIVIGKEKGIVIGKKQGIVIGKEEQYDLIARVTKELVRLKREDEIIKVILDKNYFNLLVKQFGF